MLPAAVLSANADRYRPSQQPDGDYSALTGPACGASPGSAFFLTFLHPAGVAFERFELCF